MNIVETETLAFTYDRHFHLSQKLASCPWTKQSHLGKCSNGKLCNWTLVNDGSLRSTANFASALSNVNNVKILDLVEFFSLTSYPKIICRKLQDYENVNEGDFFFDNWKKSLVEVPLDFHLQLCKSILEWLLSYEVTSSNLRERVIN